MSGSARLDDDEWLVGIGAQVSPDGGPAGADSEELGEFDDVYDEEQGGVDLDEDGTGETVEHDEQLLDGSLDAGADYAEGDGAGEAPVIDDSGDKRRRFTPWVLGAGVAAVAVATVITTVVSGLNSPSPPAGPASPSTSSRPSVPRPPAPPPAAADPNGDGPLPFTATSDCDIEAGSTPAQSLAVPDSPTPWICVLNGPGQVLDIVLGPPGIPDSYVITGVSVVTGAIGLPGRPATEPDPWLAHQLATRLQWSFDDPQHTVVPQDTHNVRGEAPLAIPRVTASRIRVIIQQTSPPPPVPTATPTAESAPGGVFGSVLGPPAPPPTSYPPVAGDGAPDTSLRTFAISRIKIIGHKANR